MYYAHQTLRRIGSTDLICLDPTLNSGSTFAWNMSGAWNENGQRIGIDIQQYTHINDFDGKTLCGRPKLFYNDKEVDEFKGTHKVEFMKMIPDLSLKRYLLEGDDLIKAQEEAKRVRFEEYKKRKDDILEKLLTVDHIHSWFYDSQIEFRDYFFKEMNVEPLYTVSNDEFSNGKRYKQWPKSHLMVYNNKVWYVDTVHIKDIYLSSITVEQYNLIKKILK